MLVSMVGGEQLTQLTQLKRRAGFSWVEADPQKEGRLNLQFSAHPQHLCQNCRTYVEAFVQSPLPAPSSVAMNMKPTLPGLSNFYMACQWIALGGGLPGAGGSARRTAELLCKKKGVPFKTSIS